MFGAIGQVESAQIVTDRDTGRSKGLAVADGGRNSCGESNRATQCNGNTGGKLTVNEARPMEKRPAVVAAAGAGIKYVSALPIGCTGNSLKNQ